MLRKMRRFTVMAAAVALAGCSIGSDLTAAKQQVATFRAQIDANKGAEMYRQAAPDLRSRTSEADWVALVAAVHRKLGKFRSAPEPGWNDRYSNGDHFLTLSYESTYERGAAQETFTYRIADGRPALAGYHVTSNALLAD